MWKDQACHIYSLYLVSNLKLMLANISIVETSDNSSLASSSTNVDFRYSDVRNKARVYYAYHETHYGGISRWNQNLRHFTKQGRTDSNIMI